MKKMTSPPFYPCNQTASWQELRTHSRKVPSLRDLFGDRQQAVKRFKDFSLEQGSLLLDYSKSRLDRKALQLLFRLTEEMHLDQARQAMFSGAPINWTEERSVLHTLLRDRKGKRFLLQEKDLFPEIHGVLDRMEAFAEKVRKGIWKGGSGKPISDVVNIGIGGSYLGPKMAVRALHRFGDGPRLHFVSNVDGNDIDYTLQGLQPETTLFLIASKTFTTEETLANARIAKRWVTDKLGEKAIPHHFACMSTNETAVREFGIDPTNMFEFWDFVGGRYSIWSAIGLPLMLAIGPQGFRQFLDGGYEMDRHFLTSPTTKNLPILMALIGIWHNNFLGMASHLVIPYASDLVYFPGYLQQMDMESNGKGVNRKGKPVGYNTGSILWGEVGTDSQHSFFQLLHQGTRISSIDFIGIAQHEHPYSESHERLMANLFAQSESLAFGLTPEETREAIYLERPESQKHMNRKEFLSQERIQALIPHRVFPGNRPSNTLLLDRLTPYALGQLIALYEHKVFVQGIIWGINSYDQWGVELGKRAAKRIVKIIQGQSGTEKPHPTTSALVKKYLKLRDLKK